MSEERRKILEMLSEGKINTDEAERLLSALSSLDSEQKESQPDSTPAEKPRPKYLRVIVEPAPDNTSGEKVNIRIPMKLLRAGIKLASLMPTDVHVKVDNALKEKGINFNLSQITEKNLEEIVESLNDLTVEVEGKEKVRIFCE